MTRAMAQKKGNPSVRGKGGMKILITSGATREPIDGVRFITNFSTGSTGAALADALRGTGHTVLYLHGQGATLPTLPGRSVEFFDFASLDSALRSLLSSGRFDAVIHLAAVSDYSVSSVTVNGKARPASTGAKLDSGENLSIELKRNFKIVDRLAAYAVGRPVFLTAFKLTCTRSSVKRKQAATELSLRPGINLVVHNDMLDIRSGRRVFTLYSRGKAAARCRTPRQLAAFIISEVQETCHATCP